MVYPDNVNTREEKILYVMAAYGISEEDSGLLRQTFDDISNMSYQNGSDKQIEP